jgi:hypothetical protein
VSRSSRWTIPGRSADSPPAVRPSSPWTSVPVACPGEERLHQRPARVAGRGVDDDPGRLVDDEEVLVLVGDPERHLLRLQRSGGRRRLELDRLAAREPVALGARLAVDQHRALLEQPLGCGARAELRQRGEKAVEPLARRLLGDRDLQLFRRGASLITSATKRMPTPTTMNESARLNAGQ